MSFYSAGSIEEYLQFDQCDECRPPPAFPTKSFNLNYFWEMIPGQQLEYFEDLWMCWAGLRLGLSMEIWWHCCAQNGCSETLNSKVIVFGQYLGHHSQWTQGGVEQKMEYNLETLGSFISPRHWQPEILVIMWIQDTPCAWVLTLSCRWVDISTWTPPPQDCLYLGPS